MVVIRLARTGAKNSPKYRVTVADQKYSAKGRFLEIVGYFNPVPTGKEQGLTLDMDRINHWVKLGAQPSDTVRTLIRNFEKSGSVKA